MYIQQLQMKHARGANRGHEKKNSKQRNGKQSRILHGGKLGIHWLCVTWELQRKKLLDEQSISVMVNLGCQLGKLGGENLK